MGTCRRFLLMFIPRDKSHKSFDLGRARITSGIWASVELARFWMVSFHKFGVMQRRNVVFGLSKGVQRMLWSITEEKLLRGYVHDAEQRRCSLQQRCSARHWCNCGMGVGMAVRGDTTQLSRHCR